MEMSGRTAAAGKKGLILPAECDILFIVIPIGKRQFVRNGMKGERL
jgi:hypothetical protein